MTRNELLYFELKCSEKYSQFLRDVNSNRKSQEELEEEYYQYLTMKEKLRKMRDEYEKEQK